MANETPDDITIVGGINLSMLKESAAPAAMPVPPAPEAIVPKPAASKPVSASTSKETASSDSKKKNNLAPKLKPSVTPKKNLRKQNWLKYVGLLGFLFLFCLIYFRKSIIQHLFHGEITASFQIMNAAHAQDVLPEKKKKILDSNIVLENVTFRPQIGMEGFRVVSSFNIEEIKCEDLNNNVYQLGVILHPPEVINENFLIKLRDCVLKLPESHPLKKWMKWVGESNAVNTVDQKKVRFLTEIINSQFNLITEAKVRNEIVNILYEVPENTLPEQILRSYLYSMAGNITRSDNILREIVSTSPRQNWSKSGLSGSVYHKIARDQMRQIFQKLGRHPADRKSFELLAMYILSFYNEDSFLKIAGEVDTSELESKLGLKFIEKLSPPFIHYLRLSRMKDNGRIKLLRNTKKYPLEEQVYWIWPFMDINPLISEVMIPELVKLEKQDELWFIYLMDNEKLADFYSSKAGKSFLPGRRPFLKEQLKDQDAFMMSLFKLIQLGDINEDLISQTINQLIND